MDSVQVIVFVLAFVAFAVMSVVAHKVLVPVPVLVPVTPEPSMEDLRNRLYI